MNKYSAQAQAYRNGYELGKKAKQEKYGEQFIKGFNEAVEKQGTWIPCKVGDTVWFNTWKQNATVCVGIQPHTVDRIDILLVCDSKNLIETKIYEWEIGKSVFLTEEEAEKALKEREQG